MKVISNDRYGSPRVLTPQERPVPQLEPDELLVEVHASVVTEGDRRLRAADFPGASAYIGRLLFGVRGPRRTVGGSNFAGRVVKVGSQVSNFEVGDRVFGSVMSGAYAEYLAVSHSSTLAKVPESVTYAEAAAMPYGAVTALVFFRDLAELRRGERVLVVGASGGVGRMAVQIAKRLGAHVTAVSGGDFDLMRSLGADDLIDYKHEDFTSRATTYDVIFDTTEGDHFRSFRHCLTDRGRYLTLYATPRALLEMFVTSFRRGPRVKTGVVMGSAALLAEVAELMELGALRPVLGKHYPLTHTAEAHAFFEEARPHATIVIDVAPRVLEAAAE